MRCFQYLVAIFFAFSLIAQSDAILEIESDFVDFGKVPQNSYLYRKVVLKSVGDQSVKISEVDTHCKCIIMPLDNKVIEPGDSLISEISFYSATLAGSREWRIHIKGNTRTRRHQIRILAQIVENIERLHNLHVFPHTIAASQFGNNLVKEFPFKIINKTEETIPLKLVYNDNEFYSLDFPVFIPPYDTANGTLTLNDRGLKSEFEKTITFEYIDAKSKKFNYSIPVRRKIFISND